MHRQEVSGTQVLIFRKNTAIHIFHADYSAGWIRNVGFDTQFNPTYVNSFSSSLGPVVALATHPTQGGLYYVRYPDQVRKISYAPTINQAPAAVARAHVRFGSSPLMVQFFGHDSFDPEGQALSYTWDFGDGSAVSP